MQNAQECVQVKLVYLTFQGCYAKWNKPERKILNDLTYMWDIFKELKYTETEIHSGYKAVGRSRRNREM